MNVDTTTRITRDGFRRPSKAKLRWNALDTERIANDTREWVGRAVERTQHAFYDEQDLRRCGAPTEAIARAEANRRQLEEHLSQLSRTECLLRRRAAALLRGYGRAPRCAAGITRIRQRSRRTRVVRAVASKCTATGDPEPEPEPSARASSSGGAS